MDTKELYIYGVHDEPWPLDGAVDSPRIAPKLAVVHVERQTPDQVIVADRVAAFGWRLRLDRTAVSWTPRDAWQHYLTQQEQDQRAVFQEVKDTQVRIDAARAALASMEDEERADRQ